MRACSQVVTTLAAIGPMRGCIRSSAKPVQATSSHQLMSTNAIAAPATTMASDTRVRNQRGDRRHARDGNRCQDTDARQEQQGDRIPARVDAEVERAPTQCADAIATLGKGRGDECSNGNEIAESRTNGAIRRKLEVDEPEAVGRRQGSAKIAAPAT